MIHKKQWYAVPLIFTLFLNKLNKMLLFIDNDCEKHQDRVEINITFYEMKTRPLPMRYVWSYPFVVSLQSVFGTVFRNRLSRRGISVQIVAERRLWWTVQTSTAKRDLNKYRSVFKYFFGFGYKLLIFVFIYFWFNFDLISMFWWKTSFLLD